MRWDHQRADDTEGGFTIVETMVALAITFVVLTGTLATFAASVRGVVTGQQRTGAVSVARSVVEEARASLYVQVGHDLAGDTGLGDDPAVSGSPPTFEGETLVGTAKPIFPSHRWTTTHDASTYDVRVYVTWVDGGVADPFKRITVLVAWENAQYDPGVVSNEVRVSSFLFEASVPSDPLVEGGADADAGSFDVDGVIGTVQVARLTIFQPTASGDVRSLFTREAAGQARSNRVIGELTAGIFSGCVVSETGDATECTGIRADTATDSDAATPLPEHDAAGPFNENARTVSADDEVTLVLEAGDTVESKSSARSCFSCYATPIGDDDQLAYHWSRGSGAGSAQLEWSASALGGLLLAMDGAATATTTVDQDEAGNSHRLVAQASMSMPALELFDVGGAPEGFAGIVRVGAVDVTVTAGAGPTAESPSVTGDAVTIQLYDELPGGDLGYREVVLEPGETREESAGAVIALDEGSVSFTTTVVSGGTSVSSTSDGSGTITQADASLANWLRIRVAVVVSDAEGVVADAVLELDYGRLAARATWESIS